MHPGRRALVGAACECDLAGATSQVQSAAELPMPSQQHSSAEQRVSLNAASWFEGSAPSIGSSDSQEVKYVILQVSLPPISMVKGKMTIYIYIAQAVDPPSPPPPNPPPPPCGGVVGWWGGGVVGWLGGWVVGVWFGVGLGLVGWFGVGIYIYKRFISPNTPSEKLLKRTRQVICDMGMIFRWTWIPLGGR